MSGAAGAGGYSASQNTSSSSSASGSASTGFNDSGFVVNFKSSGSANAATGSSDMPGWVYPALAVGALLWLIRKH